jgi:hypothetical protein
LHDYLGFKEAAELIVKRMELTTADLSTPLRSGRDDKFVAEEVFVVRSGRTVDLSTPLRSGRDDKFVAEEVFVVRLGRAADLSTPLRFGRDDKFIA